MRKVRAVTYGLDLPYPGKYEEDRQERIAIKMYHGNIPEWLAIQQANREVEERMEQDQKLAGKTWRKENN